MKITLLLSMMIGILVVAVAQNARQGSGLIDCPVTKGIVMDAPCSLPMRVVQKTIDDCEKWYRPLREMNVRLPNRDLGRTIMVSWGSSTYSVADASALATTYLACREHVR